MSHPASLPRAAAAPLAACLFLIALLLFLAPPRPALAACPGVTNVANPPGLDAAITAFNGETGPCIFRIRFTADILLGSSPPEIDNTGANVTLIIDGYQHTLNGQGNAGVQPLRIAAGTAVEIEDLTITGGRATNFGGGIFNAGDLTLTNSTLYDNSGTRGGGIYNNGGALVLRHTTVAGNSAGSFGEGLHTAGGTVTLQNSIVADSAGGRDCVNQVGTVSGDHALIEAAAFACGLSDGVNGNIVGQDPLLGSLQDNGAGALTLLPGPGSPAINGGSDALAVGLSDDQRGSGFPRLLGTAVDVGAVEACAFPFAAGSEDDLNEGIRCFNGVTAAGSYQINLTADVSLTASLLDIDNSTAGVDLTIAGGDHTIDGQDLYQPFFVAEDTVVTLENLVITGGSSATGGAAQNYGGDLTVRGSTLSGNSSSYRAGALYSGLGGALTVEDSTLAANTADFGGAIYQENGSATLIDTVVDNNTGVEEGGGILSYDGTLEISGSTISGNDADVGGGIFKPFGALTLSDSAVIENEATDGAGGGLMSEAPATVTRSTIAQNTSTQSGAGIRTFGPITVTHSLIASNEALHQGGGIVGTDGLKLINSTVSGNSADIAGGGLAVAGALTVRSSTVAANQAPAASGSGILITTATVTAVLHNTILDNDPTGGDCVINTGTVSGEHTLVADGASACGLVDGVDGNQVGVDPLLGPLQDNGGPTETHALLFGSPALDAGDNSLAVDEVGAALATDQRGGVYARIVNGTVDLGALEKDCNFPKPVATEDDLNSAIACFNSLTTPGSYVIELTAEIGPLGASTLAIDNGTPGVELTVEGAGFAMVGSSGARPFTVLGSSVVTLQNMTVMLGSNVSNGGGIHSQGVLTVLNSLVYLNSATAGGGGIYNDGGQLAIINSTVANNSAAATGSGIHQSSGSAAITNSTITYNESYSGIGGGLYVNAGSVALENSIFGSSVDGNCFSNLGTVSGSHTLMSDAGTACGLVDGVDGNIVGLDPKLDVVLDTSGLSAVYALLATSPAIDAGDDALAAGLANDQRGPGFPRVFGTAVDMGAAETCGFPYPVENEAGLNAAIECYNASTTAVTHVIDLVADIPLTYSTKAIDNNVANVDLLIEGNGFAVDGQGITNVRPFLIFGHNNLVTLHDIVITGGQSNGILNAGTLSIVDSLITGNQGPSSCSTDACAGGISNLGTLTVQDSTINNNNAILGGGIYNSNSLTVHDSTIAGNTATYWGGGVYHLGGVTTLNNSTITGNEVTDDSGGGIQIDEGLLSLNNSTVADNSAPANSGGGIYNSAGTLQLNNSLVAGNMNGGDCVGAASSLYSLIEDSVDNCGITNGVSGNIVGQDPQLGPLQDNGGPTETMMPASGSPAVGAGDNGICLPTDQRGVPRPQGSDCDMGAVEHTGQAALSGSVALQNWQTAGTLGLVTAVDQAGVMPETAVTFDPAVGTFSFPSLPLAAGGSTYVLTAGHPLHLSAATAGTALMDGDNLDVGSTTLLGGDATNDGQVGINDLSCIGGAYSVGTPNVGPCANGGSTDVTGDGNTNIFDLTLAGGNYLLFGPRPW